LEKLEDTFKFLEEHRLIASIRTSDPDDVIEIAKAVMAGGIKIIEIASTIPQAPRIIETLAKRNDSVIGAGYVTDGEFAQRAINAGAKFISSLYTDKDVIMVCKNNNVIVSQGVSTPTEAVQAAHFGADLMCLYPIDQLGGASFLRRLRRSCLVQRLSVFGGVTCENLVDYLQGGAMVATLGNALAEKSLIRAHQWQEITEKAKKFQQKLESLKVNR